MTLGEKLTALRKANNYTQEQLADILGVSRQSVSKWESDVAYPETEKLVKLGELYDCSLDYLLKEGEQTRESENIAAKDGKKPRPLFGLLADLYFERKSKTEVFGMPLWHINIGLGRTAHGVLAVGLCAKGLVSVGVLSLGLLSVGVFSLGLLAIGVFALGFAAFGSIALGVLAFGAIALGLLAAGAIAVGEFAAGALAIGKYFAAGYKAEAMIAIGIDEAIGTLFSASAVTTANRAQIIALLNEHVPAVLGWLSELIKLFI